MFDGTDGANRAWQRFVTFVTFDLPNHWNEFQALGQYVSGVQSNPIVVSPPPTGGGGSPPPPVVTPPPVVAPPAGNVVYVPRFNLFSFSSADLGTIGRVEAAWSGSLSGGIGIGSLAAVFQSGPNVIGAAAQGIAADAMVVGGQVTLYPQGTGYQRAPGGTLVIYQ